MYNLMLKVVIVRRRVRCEAKVIALLNPDKPRGASQAASRERHWKLYRFGGDFGSLKYSPQARTIYGYGF
jgi:hypothetical protein